MNDTPNPVFKKNLSKISWTKIYDREYGVQYSEAAIQLLATEKYHFPKTSSNQVVIPGAGLNTTFFIDSKSWIQLVEGLNKKYTSNVKNLEKYEKQFLFDGNNYLKFGKRISKISLKNLPNKKLLSLFLEHREKRNRYSVFAWSAFILNNYISDKATKIIDSYIVKYRKKAQKQELYDSLFAPEKKAAVLELQYLVQKKNGKLTAGEFNKLYEKFKWLSCLDIQNKPWTKEEFRQHIKPLASASSKEIIPFAKIIQQLKFKRNDLEYLFMAKRFVYIKDARDDFRREGVFYSQSLFNEIGRRMNINLADTTYLQEQEIIDFLSGKKTFDANLIKQRRKGFVIYLDSRNKLVCLQGNSITKALKLFKLLGKEEKPTTLSGRVASKGKAKGTVAIIYGVKDLGKVQSGNILVAVTTHPDYVSAMRKAAAIITDEGGITSHAAIVSREFGIPCIVGCKNATKVLKDGNLVEVNAIEGVITKL